MTNNNSLKNLDMIYALDDAAKYLKSKGLFDIEVYNYLVFEHILISTINRVEEQENKDKYKVINTLIAYCHKNIPKYRKYNFYKTIPKNRKIIALLNYYHLPFLSKMLIKIKQKVSKHD